MSDRLNTTAKKHQNSDSTFKVSLLHVRGFGVQQKSEESAPANKAELWESYQQAKKLSQKGVNVSAPALPIQAKLTIGQPGDKYEQEADSMAAQVMQMPESRLANSNITNSVQTRSIQPIQRVCAECQEEKKEESKPEEEGDQIQAKEEMGQTPELTSVWRKLDAADDDPSSSNLEDRLNGSKGGGSPLTDEVRGFMEPRFGADFNGVRVHTGSDAVQMNGALNAQAFAHGSDIYFGAGKSPGNNELTAHELTHVVQQTGQVQSQPVPGGSPDASAPVNSSTIRTLNNTASQSVSRSNSMLQCKKENEEPLTKIQGLAMYDLLPALLKLPLEIRNDEEAAGFVSGPRLVTAMHVVKAKGKPWLDFVAAHNSELSILPPDQISNIMSFLGAEKNARYFKADQLGKQFDGAVDPTGGVITLFFRVKFELAPTRIGSAQPGTPEWQVEAQKASQKMHQEFAPEFKRVVEDWWSGKGLVKPACPIGGITALKTKVVVTVVESGEHMVMHIHPSGADGRSNASKGSGVGNLKGDANKPQPHHSNVIDPTGKHQQEITTTQVPSAHEFGHAIGLDHSRCAGDDNQCYGVTAEERSDVMGAGNKLQVIKRAGKVLHDDFAPFEHIAAQWGKDVFPLALASCNKWSAG